MHRPLVLAPLTPTALLSHILDDHHHHHRAPSPSPSSSPPTTVLICAARSDFLRTAVSELHDDAAGAASDVLRATLARVAAARRVRAAFVPSVAHLRAYLSALLPPGPRLLLVYGFLDLHRDGGGGTWSAQGIGCSAACLVEAAARAGCEGVVLREPAGWEGEGGGRWAGVYEEQIPLLSTTAERREDGTWGVPCTTARAILQRWFTFDDS